MSTRFIRKESGTAKMLDRSTDAPIQYDTADGLLKYNDAGVIRSLLATQLPDPAEVVAATNVIAASESGKTFFLSAASEFVSTLPAPALGLRYTFIVAAAPSGASYTVVTASSANVILGHILSSDESAAAADSETSGGDTISFVDGQAVVGDRVDVVSDGTSWFAVGTCKVNAGITITTAS